MSSAAGAGCHAGTRASPLPEFPRVVVNGEEVPRAEFQRVLVYVYGRTYLDRRIRDSLVADEIERRRKAGQSVESLQVGAEELRAEVASRRRQLEETWATRGSDMREALRRQGFDESSLVDEAESLVRFDKVFSLDDPAQWPKAVGQAFAGQAGQLPVRAEMNDFYRTIYRQ
ncbi:MAG TPA: hypothetical protein VKF62_11640, partial [Planctomycetota bacterium]|nr:hypothetical protein [Planctomycetota bacterium]